MARPTPILACLLAALALAACGNKGDLYLLPDEIAQQEFDLLQRSLEGEDMPLAEPVEVDDQLVHQPEPTADTADENRRTTAAQ